ncbi:MAG: hypothetical protein E7214_11210 [Clostridium sp.]|nr:hypothetical protein [Clostridium sp.]
MNNKEIELAINPERVCFGLSRIGYTPSSAICDISDNAITAGATKIVINIVKENDVYNDNRLNNTKEYTIIDNGKGMNNEEILAALELGSSSENYSEDSLSKFGLGLKSASFSQGNILDITSTKDGIDINRYIINLEDIKDKYICLKEEPLEKDVTLLKEYGHGTVIRLRNIHKNNHPSIKTTISDLKEKLGVIYYYFIKDCNLEIELQGEKIDKVDVLASEGLDYDLDEHTWSGKEVGWIYRPKEFVLEESNDIMVKLEVTQLPYPPIFEIDGEASANDIRKKYGINSKNYGVYVYRNKRLISWAENFNNMIPKAINLYSFRARLNITSDSDDMFNIDVKKSDIQLSAEAQKTLSDILDDLKRKSRKAWERMTKVYKERKSEDPNKAANEIINSYPDDNDPLEDEMDGSAQEEEEKNRRKDELNKEVKEKTNDSNKTTEKDKDGENKDSDAEEKKGIHENKKIRHVDFIEDNILFERYYDATEESCININDNHRFSKLLYGDNSENADMQIIMELFYYNMMKAEVSTQTNLHKYDRKEIEEILDTYKRALSNSLTQMCRDAKNLPPIKENND